MGTRGGQYFFWPKGSMQKQCVKRTPVIFTSDYCRCFRRLFAAIVAVAVFGVVVAALDAEIAEALEFERLLCMWARPGTNLSNFYI